MGKRLLGAEMSFTVVRRLCKKLPKNGRPYPIRMGCNSIRLWIFQSIVNLHLYAALGSKTVPTEKHLPIGRCLERLLLGSTRYRLDVNFCITLMKIVAGYYMSENVCFARIRLHRKRFVFPPRWFARRNGAPRLREKRGRSKREVFDRSDGSMCCRGEGAFSHLPFCILHFN